MSDASQIRIICCRVAPHQRQSATATPNTIVDLLRNLSFSAFKDLLTDDGTEPAETTDDDSRDIGSVIEEITENPM